MCETTGSGRSTSYPKVPLNPTCAAETSHISKHQTCSVGLNDVSPERHRSPVRELEASTSQHTHTHAHTHVHVYVHTRPAAFLFHVTSSGGVKVGKLKRPPSQQGESDQSRVPFSSSFSSFRKSTRKPSDGRASVPHVRVHPGYGVRRIASLLLLRTSVSLYCM